MHQVALAENEKYVPFLTIDEMEQIFSIDDSSLEGLIAQYRVVSGGRRYLDHLANVSTEVQNHKKQLKLERWYESRSLDLLVTETLIKSKICKWPCRSIADVQSKVEFAETMADGIAMNGPYYFEIIRSMAFWRDPT